MQSFCVPAGVSSWLSYSQLFVMCVLLFAHSLPLQSSHFLGHTDHSTYLWRIPRRAQFSALLVTILTSFSTVVIKIIWEVYCGSQSRATVHHSVGPNTWQQELKAADLTSYTTRNQRKMRDAASFPHLHPRIPARGGTSLKGRIFPSQNNQGSFLKRLPEHYLLGDFGSWQIDS